MFITSTKIL